MRAHALLILLASGCGRCGAHETTAAETSASAPSVVAPAPVAPVDEEPDVRELRAMLEKFMAPGADHGALSAELVPHEDDYDAVFIPEQADRLHQFYAPRFDRGELVIQPGPEHREVLIFKATTEDIRAG